MVLTLSLGLGANLAIYSLFHGVVLRPLPFKDPERLVRLWMERPGVDLPLDNFSEGEYIEIERGALAIDAISVLRHE